MKIWTAGLDFGIGLVNVVKSNFSYFSIKSLIRIAQKPKCNLASQSPVSVAFVLVREVRDI